MKRFLLYSLGAVLLCPSLLVGGNTNQNVGIDLGVFADPKASKMVGQMLANPIYDAIKERNPESPMLEFPFGELIGAGIHLIGGAIRGGSPRREEQRTTPMPRRENLYETRPEMQTIIAANMNTNGIPGQPLYSNGYYDQFGVFRPFTPIYNGPHGFTQQGPPFYPFHPPQQPQQYPNFAGGPNGQPISNPDATISAEDIDKLLNNLPTNNGDLPTNHDFADPVDVDTLGKGRPVPPLTSPKPETGLSVDHHQTPVAPVQNQPPTRVAAPHGPVNTPQMPNYYPSSLGFYDPFGNFIPFQPIYTSPNTGSQQTTTQDHQTNTQDGTPQSSQQHPNLAGGQNELPVTGTTLRPQMKPVMRPPNSGDPSSNIIDQNVQTTSNSDAPISSDDIDNMLNNLPTNNGGLPTNHDFADPIDVDTLGKGRPVPPLNSPAIRQQPPNIVGDQNRPLMPNYYPYVIGFYDQFGHFRPLQPMHTGLNTGGQEVLNQEQQANTQQLQWQTYPNMAGGGYNTANFPRIPPYPPYGNGYYNQFGAYGRLPPVNNDGLYVQQGPGLYQNPPIDQSRFVDTAGSAPVQLTPTPNPEAAATPRPTFFVPSNIQGPCLPADFDFSQPIDINARCGKLRMNKAIQH